MIAHIRPHHPPLLHPLSGGPTTLPLAHRIAIPDFALRTKGISYFGRRALTRSRARLIMEGMKLLPSEPAALDVRPAAQIVELTERAHAHLNGRELPAARGRPTGVKNGEGRAPKIILKKLSLRHKQAISLVLQGESRELAAEVAGFVPEYITFLLQQPVAKEYIAHINRAVSTHLEALYGKSVEAIAGGLRASDPDVKLRAAKLQLQTTGRLEPDQESQKTAEDVVQAILLGVQVNVNQKG